MVPWLGADDPFPPVERALGAASGAPGLLAASADLLPSRLIDAYRRGIFPWYSDGQPVLWWSPDPRMILRPADFKLSPSLRKTLRRVLRDDAWEIRVDHDFAAVMRACAQAPRRGQRGTWITADVIEAYSSLHRVGDAHSIETWFEGRRVGGLYGVSFGRMFFGESMFSAASGGSKVALAALAHRLAQWGWPLIDTQVENDHLLSMGAEHWPRTRFLALVREQVRLEAPTGPWTERFGDMDAALLAGLG